MYVYIYNYRFYMCIYIHVCQNWFMKPLTGKPTLG